MIVAFSGRKFAGKDSAAEGLIRFYGFKRIGLADKLKDICSVLFDIPRDHMDDPIKKEHPFNCDVKITTEHLYCLLRIIQRDGFEFDFESVLESCKNFEGRNLTSIRDMLQTVGTDILRNHVQDDIWLQYIRKSLEQGDGNIVITDARFQNERDYLRSLGAVLILVKRPETSKVEEASLHISENQLGLDSDYDVVLHNNDTLTALQSNIAMWYTVKKDAITCYYKRKK